MTLLCVAPSCFLPRHHTTKCTDEDCRGCSPALAEDGRVCTRCFDRERTTLREIADFHARLPEFLDRSDSQQPRVSGTPAHSAPFDLDVWDLLQDANPDSPDLVHDPHHDQTGSIPVAQILFSWARDWAETRNQREKLPVAAAELTTWLLHRLEWAAKEHLAVDDFITETRRLRNRLARAVGEVDPPPEPCIGVPCRRCDLLTLYRGQDGDIECHNANCHAVLRPDEYTRWLGLLAAGVKRRELDTHTTPA